MSTFSRRARPAPAEQPRASAPASADAGSTGWLEEIPARRILDETLEARFMFAPGDRPLVEPGDRVAPGQLLFERLRDRRIEEVAIPIAADGPNPDDPAHPQPATGRRWSPAARSRHRRHAGGTEGELLTPVGSRLDRWRLVTGDHRDSVESPVTGEVTSVVPGSEIIVRPEGFALRGALAAGAPAFGRLELATDAYGELGTGHIDVGRAGSILVVGDRIDAEALTRARAMGVRGVIVASLSGKDLRDFQASERRQRASLHGAPPFGVVALDGTVRRPIAGPVAALLKRLAGRDVGLLIDPPALVFEADEALLPVVDPAWVRIRSGPMAGTEGRVAGPSVPYWFPTGVHLEAAPVVIGGGATLMVAVGDLERLV
jgi:hypothetical protein